MALTTSKLTIQFGSLADPLAVQIKKQGFKYDISRLEVFQKESDAITQLRFGTHLLTDGVVDKLRQKLFNAISKHVAQFNTQNK